MDSAQVSAITTTLSDRCDFAQLIKVYANSKDDHRIRLGSRKILEPPPEPIRSGFFFNAQQISDTTDGAFQDGMACYDLNDALRL